jgi:RNA polymerase sigma-70 factor (ECF subfamily)
MPGAARGFKGEVARRARLRACPPPGASGIVGSPRGFPSSGAPGAGRSADDMTSPIQDGPVLPLGAPQFLTTRWTVVLAAGGADAARSGEALEALCRAYWYPLYAWVRRQGRSPEDAEDLTQAFFASLLARRDLGGADRAKGRFRSFLLASMKHFLANERDRARAQKRGGGQPLLALDAGSAETRYALEPSHGESADRVFERRWALTLLDATLARLRAEYARDGKERLFDELKETLAAGRGEVPYAGIGARMGMGEGAVKVAAHRLRRRYREALRSEIADTVASPGEVEEELRHLHAAVSR